MTATPNHHPDPARGADEEKAVKTHLLCAVALGAVALAGAAAAQETATVNVGSTVAPYCQSLSGFAPPPLELGELADNDGQVVADFAGDTSVSITNFYCNSKATVSLEAQPLRVTPSVAVSDPGFTSDVHYTASFNWAGVTGSDQSITTGATLTPTTAATTGSLTVTVSEPETEDGRRPVAGAYVGAVILNINPTS